MTDKILKRRILMENKEIIIRNSKKGIPIIKIAQEYGVHFTTMYNLLKEWKTGEKKFKRTRPKPPKDQEIDKGKKIVAFKKSLNPELRARIEENTRINDKYIKFYGTVETEKDNFLVRDILKKKGE